MAFVFSYKDICSERGGVLTGSFESICSASAGQYLLSWSIYTGTFLVVVARRSYCCRHFYRALLLLLGVVLVRTLSDRLSWVFTASMMSRASHLKSCSFSSLGRCFLETYTKAKTVRNVSSEEIELLSLRSKLASADIHNICSHHEKEYLLKYSTLQRRCCNAFALHENTRKKCFTGDHYGDESKCIESGSVSGTRR